MIPKVEQKKKIAIIGLGYVGLPLAMLFLYQGFKVIGIDTNENKINDILNCKSYLPGISNVEIKKFINKQLEVYSNIESISEADVIIICVPTPLKKDSEPDLSYLINVGENLYSRVKKGQLIILESSTFPGTTREILQPILEKSGLKIGTDLFLAYSPERIDPGNKNYSIKDIPKIVSGMTGECLTNVFNLYSNIFNNIIKVSTPEIAEMSKLLENSYRFINISFINELAILCDLLKINVWEVIEAASTKPFGFSPFYPGPGIGGHCIPVDPLYLQWKSNQVGKTSNIISAASFSNQLVSDHILKQIVKILTLNKNSVENKKVLICGVTYKKDINDMRESPAIPIIDSLLKKGVKLSYHDPFIMELKINEQVLRSIDITKNTLKEFDCVVILTDHSSLPRSEILQFSKTVYDTRNFSNYKNINANLYLLGGGQI
ncbi:nucleotide sugar dehydrogenase [Cytobacillus firmus]|uniref:nucleotide sugar dehydrogenase n=1 Tax=Cytobacillus firmus TaxID=1399 RepID=UPI00216388BF|nr:nucleotide sugar dehydrogenase [Cytobacillus firmus]MCS0673867.1 nucleotide sugar dehydrogenase [Cytobacillus firmus]